METISTSFNVRRKRFALRKTLRVRADSTDLFQARPFAHDQVVGDGVLHLGHDRQLVLEHQIVVSVDRALDGVLDWQDPVGRLTLFDRREHVIERRARHWIGRWVELQRGGFAVRSGNPLIRNPHGSVGYKTEGGGGEPSGDGSLLLSGAHVHVVQGSDKETRPNNAAVYPERVLLLHFDRLCREPVDGVLTPPEFVGVSPVAEVLERLSRRVSAPDSIGRFKPLGLDNFAPVDVEFIQSLGFDTPSRIGAAGTKPCSTPVPAASA